MKEKILLSMVLTSIILTGAIASDINLVDNKSVYIDIDTKPGAILLESENEYKQYLVDKSKKTAEDDQRAVQLNKNCADIAMLKTAVAKLISDTRTVSDKEVIDRKDIDGLQLAVSELNTTKVVEVPVVVKEIPPVIKKTCETEACAKIIISTVNESVLKESYSKLKENKSFNVAETTGLYKYPIKGTKPFNIIKAGTKISADMTTMGGWVHAAGKGWVSGYDLTPKFEQTKDKDGKRPANLFIKKTVKKCQVGKNK